MEYSWDIHEIFMGYSWDIHGIFMEYSWDIHGIFMGYGCQLGHIANRYLGVSLSTGFLSNFYGRLNREECYKS